MKERKVKSGESKNETDETNKKNERERGGREGEKVGNLISSSF